MAEVGKLTINITFPDEEDIKKLSGIIGEMVEEKYKQAVKETQVLELNTPSADEMFTKFKALISESKLGGSVCCGMGVGIHHGQQPFTVQGGQVFISGAKVENKEEPKHKPFITVDGETYISNTRLTDLGISFCGGKDGSSAILNITKN